MAGTLYEYSENLINKASQDILILLGDRNSNIGSASYHVLKGSLSFYDFKLNLCQLSKSLNPVCDINYRYSLFSSASDNLSYKFNDLGSHMYLGKYSWIDELMIFPQNLLKDEGIVDIKNQYLDHNLIWLKNGL